MLEPHVIKVIAPLVFRAADKFFKFISWSIIITVLDYSQRVTESIALWYVHLISIMMFGLTIFLQANYLMFRDPADWNIPPELVKASRVVQVVLGLVLVILTASPILVLDAVVGSLAEARLK